MKTLLQINSSLFDREQSTSSQLAHRFADGWQRFNPGGAVVLRDLASEPVPHLSAEVFQAFTTPAEQRNSEQRAATRYSDVLIEELRRADTVVIGLPMYNFGVPSTLKAYFDHVARAGETFRYTEKGPVGLLKGKKAIVFATRGGRYAGTPRDTQTSYIRDFLAFIGIDDVEFVYAEGLAMGETSREQSLAEANETLRQLRAA